MWTRFLADYGMLLVLAALCVALTLGTIELQHPTGQRAADELSESLKTHMPAGARIAIFASVAHEDKEFADALASRLKAAGHDVVAQVNGDPQDGARALRKLAEAGVRIDALALSGRIDNWLIFDDFDERYPLSRGARRFQPTGYYWPTFLNRGNILNIAGQIAIVAIMAIGMTMVIVAGGIDLSVGSLLALSALLAAWLIRECGAREASVPVMVLCCAAAITASALIGLGTGMVVTAFHVPPFIVTLGIMLIARGSAARLTEGQTISELSATFTWLGRESMLGLPIAVWLMLLLYLIAHLIMSQTILGRYLYAVGGNPEAARLAGVPIQRIIVFSYVVSAALAGLGGVILASQLQSGSPVFGANYELFVIAAVVVGGTSLSGGEGKVLGTLIGALVIGVINNGMNLLNLKSWDQEIVLGAVIILAVLLDRIKQLGWLRVRGV